MSDMSKNEGGGGGSTDFFLETTTPKKNPKSEKINRAKLVKATVSVSPKILQLDL